MKKDELIASLDKIQPREELIQSTLLRIKEQEQPTKRKLFAFPAFSYRYAGVLCSLVLLLGIGIGLYGNDSLDIREESPYSLQHRQTTKTEGQENIGINAAAFSAPIPVDTSTAILNGSLQECQFETSGASLKILIHTIDKQTAASSLQGMEGTVINATISFSNQEEMNSFATLSSGEMTFHLSLQEGDGETLWQVTKYEAAAQKSTAQ